MEIGGCLAKDVESIGDLQAVVELSKKIFDKFGDQWVKHIDQLNNAAELLNHVSGVFYAMIEFDCDVISWRFVGIDWKLAT
jgi:hypothetical protein